VGGTATEGESSWRFDGQARGRVQESGARRRPVNRAGDGSTARSLVGGQLSGQQVAAAEWIQPSMQGGSARSSVLNEGSDALKVVGNWGVYEAAVPHGKVKEQHQHTQCVRSISHRPYEVREDAVMIIV
jgi:hypothetical protein